MRISVVFLFQALLSLNLTFDIRDIIYVAYASSIQLQRLSDFYANLSLGDGN